MTSTVESTPMHVRKQHILCLALFAAATLSLGTASAQEFEHHAAHEHGKVALNLVVEGSSLTIELDSPAVNLIGFEHKPSSPQEQGQLDAMNEYLRAGRGLFGVPAAAGCRKSAVEVNSPSWPEKHADHDHSHAHGHEHADFEARFTFTCAAPEKLAWIEFWLLERFQAVTEVRLNTITAAGQATHTVKDARSRLPLR